MFLNLKKIDTIAASFIFFSSEFYFVYLFRAALYGLLPELSKALVFAISGH
jgi:hypothetical protein